MLYAVFLSQWITRKQWAIYVYFYKLNILYNLFTIKGSFKMKSIFVKSALVLAVLGGLAGCKTINDALDGVNNALSDMNSALNPAEEVSASQICKEWRNNETRANAAWLNKNIILKGKISSISNYDTVSYDKNSMVHLDVNGGVRAAFVFANNNAVMDFNKGQRITLKGKLTNISHNIGSGSCSFILDNSSKVN